MRKKLGIVPLIILTIALTSLFLTGQPTSADGNVSITRTFSASADSFIEEGNPAGNNGTTTPLEVRRQNNNRRYAIIRFDISIIPTGATVSSAGLSLYQSVGSAGDTDGAHRVTSDWQENNVTWNSHSTAFNSTPTATITTQALQTHTWNVTSDVSAFVSGTANYGWVIKDEGTSGTASSSWTSREGSSNQPQLSVTFTAPWDSYQEEARTNILDLYNGTYNIAYMKGTGFKAGNYNVAYYDAGASGGQQVLFDENKSLIGSTLQSQINLHNYSSSTPGNWHALVQPASGYTSLFGTNYTTANGAPNTYGLVAHDSFEVTEGAIPEFPTVAAGIAVAGTCFGVFYWMRKRAKFKMKRAK